MRTEVVLKKESFRSPLVLLSGTVSSQILEFIRPEAVGLAVLKTITLKPRQPNPEPRMWDLSYGVLNSIGLFNPGVEKFLESELKKYLELDFDYGLSIAGFSVDEFEELIDIVKDVILQEERIKVLELNFSCPNVKEGGIAFASQETSIERITKKASHAVSKEIWVKVSPAFPVEAQIKAGLRGGATAAVVANTMPAVYLNEKMEFVPGAGSGGLSGRALFPINLLNVKKASEIETEIVASGGVEGFSEFKKYLKAGASMVGIGTALFRFPDIPNQIYVELQKDMQAFKVESFEDYLKVLRSA